MPKNLTRQGFLKLSSAAALGYALRDFPALGAPYNLRQPRYSLGRTVYSLRYYEQPSAATRELGYYIRDTVVKIHEERVGDPGTSRNPLWLRTDEGWVHGAYVQPVEFRLNEPLTRMSQPRFLVEVTVPWTQSWRVTENGWKRSYRFYYASTYWIHHSYKSKETGKIWYHVYDERTQEYHLAEAEHFRLIQADELTPLSPGVPNKRIEVNLDRQKLTAFEGNRPVFVTRIATGYYEGDTPRGEFQVERKQPTRHMAAELDTDFFDLPGVPWVCYIFWTGVSFHGTYWHRNYGTPQSHGCINLTPDAAKWVYRWTEPYLPFDDDFVQIEKGSNSGTRVIVY